MKLIKVMLIGLSLALSSTCFAQSVEEVVVTGIHSGEYTETPSVTYKKKADFLVQSVRLVNDSRSPELRKSEIIQTIKNLISSSKKIKGIVLNCKGK